jgi:hypothetical protein
LAASVRGMHRTNRQGAHSADHEGGNNREQGGPVTDGIFGQLDSPETR